MYIRGHVFGYVSIGLRETKIIELELFDDIIIHNHDDCFRESDAFFQCLVDLAPYLSNDISEIACIPG